MTEQALLTATEQCGAILALIAVCGSRRICNAKCTVKCKWVFSEHSESVDAIAQSNVVFSRQHAVGWCYPLRFLFTVSQRKDTIRPSVGFGLIRCYYNIGIAGRCWVATKCAQMRANVLLLVRKETTLGATYCIQLLQKSTLQVHKQGKTRIMYVLVCLQSTPPCGTSQ